MKKILVPTDFSKYALHATKLAANIAKRFDARVYLLHVVDMPNYGGLAGDRTNQEMAESLLLLKHVKHKFNELLNQPFLKGVNAVTAIQFDGVYKNVIDQADKHEIDLIVMGTHGSSGYINDFFVGSNTDKIVRRSNIPVLTTREEVKNPHFEKIVFASDFGDGIRESFSKIADLVKQFDSHVDFVRIITKNDFYYTGPMLDLMDEFAKDFELTKYDCSIYTAEDVQTGINEFARRRNADMIATITRGKRGLARLFNGSNTRDLMDSSPLPVFSIQAAK